jgi:hypothetical protein
MAADPLDRKALIVTYTFGAPAVVGVFFRAVRLALHLRTRGWRILIFNFGPIMDDPKLSALPPGIEIRNDIETESVAKALRQFRAARPDAVIFGEAPFDGSMQRLWRASALLGKPFFLLEQYYDTGTPGNFDVDLMLLYGLKCFWSRHENGKRRWVMVSPFIGSITPPERLPVPPAAPRVVILGFEPVVLEKGLAVLAALDDLCPQVVALSHDPAAAACKMAAAGIPESRAFALPLQDDATLYGLIHSSAASIVANGFMQIMESVALCCPPMCMDRGIGMWNGQLNSVFHGHASFSEDLNTQRETLRSWLTESPFDADLRARLSAERNGAAECADHIERVLDQPPTLGIRLRQARYAARQAREWTVHMFQSAAERSAAAKRREAA